MAIEAKRTLWRRAVCSCSMTGVWRALSYIDGMVVIFHSPRACAHIANRMDTGGFYYNIADGIDETGLKSIPLLSSDLKEDDSVFGGEERLRRAIRYAVDEYHPKAIFIANSCVSGVIGDDTQAVASDMEAECKIPIMAVSAHGFLDGEHFGGYIDTAKALLERFVEPSPKKPNSVLLLGDCGGIYSEYVTEIKRYLSYFSLEVFTQFPSYTSFEDLQKLSSVSLTIVLGRRNDDVRQQRLVDLAKYMEDNFATPYIASVYPVGFKRTIKWLATIGEAIGKEKLAEEIIEKETLKFNEYIASAKKLLQGKKTIYFNGRLLQYDDSEDIFPLLDEVGIEIVGVRLFDSYTQEAREKIQEKIGRYTCAPFLTNEETEKLLKDVDVALTTNEILSMDIRQVFLPFMAHAGWLGERHLLDAIKKVLCRKMTRGGLIYA